MRRVHELALVRQPDWRHAGTHKVGSPPDAEIRPVRAGCTGIVANALNCGHDDEQAPNSRSNTVTESGRVYRESDAHAVGDRWLTQSCVTEMVVKYTSMHREVSGLRRATPHQRRAISGKVLTHGRRCARQLCSSRSAALCPKRRHAARFANPPQIYSNASIVPTP